MKGWRLQDFSIGRFLAYFSLTLTLIILSKSALAQTQWAIHDTTRPRPGIVDPGNATKAPADAIVLFDGGHLDAWERPNGSKPAWKVENGYFEVFCVFGTLFKTACRMDPKNHGF